MLESKELLNELLQKDTFTSSMNTKQLWQALTSNPVTQPYFDGIL